jgi:YidC/Oxa1 family membrane protein insertase
VKELSDEKRLLVAFLAMIVILFVWGKFYKPPPPPAKPPTAPAVSTGTNSQSAQGNAASPAGAASSASTKANAALGPGQAAPLPTAAQAGSETTLVVESPLCRIEFSNRGAVARSWKLKSYLDDEKPPKPLELVNSSAAQQFNAWPLSLYLPDQPAQQPGQQSGQQLQDRANSGLYQITPAPTASAPGAPTTLTAPVTLEFHWSDGHLDVTKSISLTDDYTTLIKVTATLDGKLLPAGVAWRGGFGDIGVSNQSQSLVLFYSENGKINTLAIKKLGTTDHQDIPVLQEGQHEFAGLEDMFFTAAFLPPTPPASGAPATPGLSLWHWVQQHEIGDNDRPAQEPEAQIAVGEAIPAPLNMRLFVGPKDLRILAHLRPQLDGLVNLGWFGVIAKPLMQVLQYTHRYIPNWGWAIVILTLIINMALFPLKISQFRSMKKMQRVQPEVSQIQNRYKKYSMSDPRKRKMNEEVMAVYQREGVNPLGSCFPMLIQLPFIYAFYRMIGGTIELRHAPWFGWIHDLSVHDPYYILPLAMMASTFIMQKMTPTPTTDPTQQRMAQIMPLALGFIFFRLSAGLNLYYFTSNLVGVGQQVFLNRTDPLKGAPNSKPGKPAKLPKPTNSS